MIDSTIVSAIADVVIAALGFGGGLAVAVVTQKHTDKRHTEDVDAQNKGDVEKKIEEMQKKCDTDVASVRNETKASFDLMNQQLGELKDMFTDMHAGYQQTISVISLQIENLEKAQNKHNDVITRTFLCEKDIEVLKNRESVSEHRLDDAEKLIEKVRSHQEK